MTMPTDGSSVARVNGIELGYLVVGEGQPLILLRREAMLFGAEAHEHGSMVHDGPIRHVPAEDLAELLLVSSPHVGFGRLVLEFDAVELRSPDGALLPGDRE